MHFALPPRKTSYSHPYPSRGGSTAFSTTRRNARLQQLVVTILGAIGVIWLVIHIFGSLAGGPHIPSGSPKAVVVTVFDEAASDSFKAQIMENRKDYASRHGYKTFFPSAADYPTTPSSPTSWAMLPALRHAMTLHPNAALLFYLAPSALIMNPTFSLENHIMAPSRLTALMQKDRPIVPPDSVIRTFSHLKPENIDFVLAQDATGLSQSSIVIRTGDWARYLLDAWYDPLYRSYNFQKAERHALEHIVQWHGTILSHLALVPQRVLNSYIGPSGIASKSATPTPVDGASEDGTYVDGDFVANFEGCNARPVEGTTLVQQKGGKKVTVMKTKNDCEAEMASLLGKARGRREAEQNVGR